MITLTRYMSRLFLGHLVVVLFGFVALLQAFDLLKNADGVMQRHGESILPLIRYAGLRLPETVSFLLPLGVLMATLLTLTKLVRHNEILALRAAGLSVYRLLPTFAPVAFAIFALHFFMGDQIVPLARQALIQWDAESRTVPAGGTASDRESWIRSGTTIVRVENVLAKGTELRGITLFIRDDKGNLVEQIDARTARYAAGKWRLFQVRRSAWPAGQAPQVTQIDEMPWPSDLDPKQLANLSTPPSRLSLLELIDFVTNPGLGEHPRYFYETWLHKRIAMPFASLVMILLAVPVANSLNRGMGARFAASMGLGFLFLVTDGVILTLGEAGLFPPALAAWTPVLIFTSIGGTILISVEGY